MNTTAKEQGLLVKNAYPDVTLATCLKGCGYFLKYLPWMGVSESGKYAGVCICAKTGKGIGPRCQAPS